MYIYIYIYFTLVDPLEKTCSGSEGFGGYIYTYIYIYSLGPARHYTTRLEATRRDVARHDMMVKSILKQDGAGSR